MFGGHGSRLTRHLPASRCLHNVFTQTKAVSSANLCFRCFAEPVFLSLLILKSNLAPLFLFSMHLRSIFFGKLFYHIRRIINHSQKVLLIRLFLCKCGATKKFVLEKMKKSGSAFSNNTVSAEPMPQEAEKKRGSEESLLIFVLKRREFFVMRGR